MTLLSLCDMRTGAVRQIDADELRLGRDPDCELVVEGEGAGVVSGFRGRAATWRVGRATGLSWLVDAS